MAGPREQDSNTRACDCKSCVAGGGPHFSRGLKTGVQRHVGCRRHIPCVLGQWKFLNGDQDDFLLSAP